MLRNERRGAISALLRTGAAALLVPLLTLDAGAQVRPTLSDRLAAEKAREVVRPTGSSRSSTAS